MKRRFPSSQKDARMGTPFSDVYANSKARATRPGCQEKQNLPVKGKVFFT